MGTTSNYSWEYPDDGGDADTWGAIHTTMVQAIDSTLKSQINAVYTLIGQVVPTGTMLDFAFAFTPTGFVQFDGSTIGNASSNATGRANADTLALFTNVWNQYDNTACPIRTSSGSLTTRGANAAADFAANKALGTPDLRGYFMRVWDNSRGVDSGRAFGSFQDDEFEAHTHSFSISNNDSNGSYVANAPDTSGGSVTTSSAGGTETRPKNFASFKIVKL